MFSSRHNQLSLVICIGDVNYCLKLVTLFVIQSLLYKILGTRNNLMTNCWETSSANNQKIMQLAAFCGRFLLNLFVIFFSNVLNVSCYWLFFSTTRIWNGLHQLQSFQHTVSVGKYPSVWWNFFVLPSASYETWNFKRRSAKRTASFQLMEPFLTQWLIMRFAVPGSKYKWFVVVGLLCDCRPVPHIILPLGGKNSHWAAFLPTTVTMLNEAMDQRWEISWRCWRLWWQEQMRIPWEAKRGWDRIRIRFLVSNKKRLFLVFNSFFIVYSAGSEVIVAPMDTKFPHYWLVRHQCWQCGLWTGPKPRIRRIVRRRCYIEM